MTLAEQIQEIGDLVTPQNVQEDRISPKKESEKEVKKDTLQPIKIKRHRPGFTQNPRKRREGRAA